MEYAEIVNSQQWANTVNWENPEVDPYKFYFLMSRVENLNMSLDQICTTLENNGKIILAFARLAIDIDFYENFPQTNRKKIEFQDIWVNLSKSGNDPDLLTAAMNYEILKLRKPFSELLISFFIMMKNIMNKYQNLIMIILM